MLKVSKTSVMNLENAIRGARNPLNSWTKSDSFVKDGMFELGEQDRILARRLCRAGSDHRKFIRQIFVWYDLIQLLPSSYQQLRTCSLNYEVLIHIYYARKEHKLEEWHTFCRWVEELPYAKDLILIQDEGEI